MNTAPLPVIAYQLQPQCMLQLVLQLVVHKINKRRGISIYFTSVVNTLLPFSNYGHHISQNGIKKLPYNDNSKTNVNQEYAHLYRFSIYLIFVHGK